MLLLCRHNFWCPFPVGPPVPLGCHLWVIVGQVIAWACSSANIVGAALASGAVADLRLPPVQLLSLAQATAPPGLLVTIGRNDDAAQMGITLMVPILLQVWSQPADVRGFSSDLPASKAIVMLLCLCKGNPQSDRTAAPGKHACLDLLMSLCKALPCVAA